MASLMEEFVFVLEEENKRYRELVELSKEKTHAIVYAELEKLQDVTEQEQVILDKIANLEKKRAALRTDMANVLNIEVEQLTLYNMAQMFEKRPDDKKKLLDLRETLRLTLIEVAKVNKENEKLLKQALEMLDFDMTLLRSMRQAPTTANYTKNAYSADVYLPSGGFDAKQ